MTTSFLVFLLWLFLVWLITCTIFVIDAGRKQRRDMRYFADALRARNDRLARWLAFHHSVTRL